jgi:hypothetical protein
MQEVRNGKNIEKKVNYINTLRRKLMKKLLINFSNHPAVTWTSAQREGWDEIVDLEFPFISPNESIENIRNIVNNFVDIIQNQIEINPGYKVYIHLSGEYTFCFLMYEKIKELNIPLAISTSERKTTFQIDSKGRTVSKKIFQFSGWRILAP